MKIFALSLFFVMAGVLRAAEPEIMVDTYDLARFGEVHVYRATERSREVAIFLSGDGGWNQGVVDMAKAIARHDTVVIGIDIPRYLQKALHDKQKCTYAAGDFEMLAQYVQKQLGFEVYQRPFLIGYSSGATIAYAALVQAPPEAFKGALTLGFCADLALKKPLCAGEGLRSRLLPKGKGYDFSPAPHLRPRWVTLNGELDRVCSIADVRSFVTKVGHGELVALPKVGHGFGHETNWMPQFVAAYERLTKEHVRDEAREAGASVGTDKDLAAETRALPLIEVPAKKVSDTAAILLTGDGGWASFDRKLAQLLADGGMGVVGFDSLKYFWNAKAFSRAGRDLGYTMEAYRQKWGAKHIVLIGYSFGADVLPSMILQLPPERQHMIRSLVLISPSQSGSTEIDVMSWLGRKGGGDFSTFESLRKVPVRNVQCFYGREDKGSLCPLVAKRAKVVAFRGGHRMNSFVTDIAQTLLVP